tara:strand:- start:61737 stop:62276 length:540 start_codon:yes stop_codon:yes gene_type:complete
MFSFGRQVPPNTGRLSSTKSAVENRSFETIVTIETIGDIRQTNRIVRFVSRVARHQALAKARNQQQRKPEMKNFAKTITFTAVGAISLAAVSLFTAAPASAAYACKNSHSYESAAGVNPNAATAVKIAQASWQSKMKSQYGLPWSLWSVAKGKQTSCVNSGGNQKTCIVRARPCKYVTG